MAVSNIYYSDNETKLNVFEKKTKSGGNFYFMYLSINKITEDQVKFLAQNISTLNPYLTVKTKKGGKSYQISWSHPTSISLSATSISKEKEMFDMIFDLLKNWGYVDDYNPKTSKTSVARKTRTTKNTTPTQRIEVGDLIRDAKGKLMAVTDRDELNTGRILLTYNYLSLNGQMLMDGTNYEEEFKNAEIIKIQGGQVFKSNLGVEYEIIDVFTDSNGLRQVKYNITTPNFNVLDDVDLLVDVAKKIVLNSLDLVSANPQPTIQAPQTTTPTSSDLTSLEFNDLFIRKDGKLYVVENVEGIYPKDNVFFVDIPNTARVQFRTFDTISNEFVTTFMPFSDVKKNNDDKYLVYLGQVKVGYKFRNDTNELEVKEVTPISIQYIINDYIGNNPPKNLLTQRNIIVEFINRLLRGDYKLYEGGNVQQSVRKFQVGDVFQYIGSKPQLTDPNIYQVTEISEGNLYITNTEKKGATQFFWVIESRGKKMIEDGEIRFITQAPQSSTSKPSNKATISEDSILLVQPSGKNVFGVIAKFLNSTSFKEIAYQTMYQGNLSEYTSKLDDFIQKGFKFLRFEDGQEFVNSFGELVFKITDASDYPKKVTYEIRGVDTKREHAFSIGQMIVLQGLSLKYSLLSKSNQPTITNDEINALRREISDLLFLKSGVSDLDFELQINLGSEIKSLQKKINDINARIFEQQVGDNEIFDKLFEQSFLPLKNRYTNIQPNQDSEFIAPNGELSDHDEDIQRIINSKEFIEWFGDWKNAFFFRNLPDLGGINLSKVLNDKFEPQLVWHGTNNQFSYFDFENFPANYFAVNKEYSEFFAINKGGGQGYVLPFFLNIKNPLDLSMFGNDLVSNKDFFDYMYLKTGKTKEQLQVNPLFMDDRMEDYPIWGYIRGNATMLKILADDKVYDGIKFYEFIPNLMGDINVPKEAKETLAYIIFEPNQAKLVDPERGDILLASLKSFMLKSGGKI